MGSLWMAAILPPSLRHVTVMPLDRAQQSLLSFLESFAAGMPLEIVSLDLRDALNSLGEVTGETTTDDILDQIFTRFCIGK